MHDDGSVSRNPGVVQALAPERLVDRSGVLADLVAIGNPFGLSNTHDYRLSTKMRRALLPILTPQEQSPDGHQMATRYNRKQSDLRLCSKAKGTPPFPTQLDIPN